MKLVAPAIALSLIASTAYASPYDGSLPMSCALQTVMMCGEPLSCVRGTAASALLPPVIKIDVAERTLRGDAAGRVVKIVSVGHGGGRLVLHGDEVAMSGTAWNVVVEEKSGALTGAVLTYVGGYLVFGSCAAS